MYAEQDFSENFPDLYPLIQSWRESRRQRQEQEPVLYDISNFTCGAIRERISVYTAFPPICYRNPLVNNSFSAHYFLRFVRQNDVSFSLSLNILPRNNCALKILKPFVYLFRGIWCNETRWVGRDWNICTGNGTVYILSSGNVSLVAMVFT